MKHVTLRRALALPLVLALMLTVAACGSRQQGSSGKPDPSEVQTPTPTPTQTPGTTPDPEVTPTVAPDEPFVYSEAAQAAIDGLYINYWRECFAASYLGYREEGDTTDLAAWLHNEAPALAAFWPFLLEIPEEDIIGEYGDLYCVVPLVENGEITVKGVEWGAPDSGMQSHDSDPLYCGEVSRPFLIYVSYKEDEPDLFIEYAREDGFVASWFPAQREGNVINPTDDDGNRVILDFARLYDIGDYVPHLDNSLAPDSQWLPPTALGLAYTWCSDNGWVLEFSYDANADNVFGEMTLYQPIEDENGTHLSPYFESSWWITDDCLCLGYYDGYCPFPLLISPSGEHLVIMKSADGSVLPFFEPGQTCTTLTLNCG